MLINSCGPFTHGYYSWNGIQISHEGPLIGRAQMLAAKAKQVLDDHQSTNLSSKSSLRVLDVGSFDGWILNQLHSYGYTELVGLEPRLQNIERGIKLREILQIEDTAHHYQGTLQNPGEFQVESPFDVVLCFGVIHHINDISGFIRDLHESLKPGGTLLLECLTLDDELTNETIASALEPKDVIYENRNKEVSIIGVKLESAYYPGSADFSGTVQIPSRRALVWFLEFNGFIVQTIESGWEAKNHLEILSQTHRKEARSTLITASSKDLQLTSIHSIEYEEMAVLQCLSLEVIRKLETIINETTPAYSEEFRDQLVTISSQLSKNSSTIVMSMIHAPFTKLTFEQGKTAAMLGDTESACLRFKSIVMNINDDWRSTYRSFYLLRLMEDSGEDKYGELAQRCNPQFPIEVLNGSFSWAR